MRYCIVLVTSRAYWSVSTPIADGSSDNTSPSTARWHTLRSHVTRLSHLGLQPVEQPPLVPAGSLVVSGDRPQLTAKLAVRATCAMGLPVSITICTTSALSAGRTSADALA